MTLKVSKKAALSMAALLAACSGNGGSVTPSMPAGSTARDLPRTLAAYGPEGSGVAPNFLPLLRFGRAGAGPSSKGALPPQLLAISDFGTGAVEFLNRQYKDVGAVTNGINGPDGDFIDDKENIYVANYAAGTVTEYNKSRSLIFTYSSGLTDPVNVTVDRLGNVFVADYGGGVVVEYPQGSNTPSESCTTGLANEGVAIDYGNVFVDGNNANTVGTILEYRHGLNGCTPITLGATLKFAGGMQLDVGGNLVVCDQTVGVDIIPSPYDKISKTLTDPNAIEYFHDALSKDNGLLFIADPGAKTVWVDDYPEGDQAAILGSAQGLSDPSGVATYPFRR